MPDVGNVGVSFAMTVMGACITIILFGRMIEIYIYASVGPLPLPLLPTMNGAISGTNYVRGACGPGGCKAS